MKFIDILRSFAGRGKHRERRLHDSVGCKGVLDINVWKGDAPRSDEERERAAFDGRLAHSVTGMNLVVNMGRAIMSRIICGDVAGLEIPLSGGGAVSISNSESQLSIGFAKVGTGGYNAGTGTVIPATSSGEDLFAPVADPAFISVTPTWPAATTVTFTSVLSQEEAIGEHISEEGLFAAGNGGTELLFAHRTFPVMIKETGFSFEFRHSLIF